MCEDLRLSLISGDFLLIEKNEKGNQGKHCSPEISFLISRDERFLSSMDLKVEIFFLVSLLDFDFGSGNNLALYLFFSFPFLLLILKWRQR